MSSQKILNDLISKFDNSDVTEESLDELEYYAIHNSIKVKNPVEYINISWIILNWMRLCGMMNVIAPKEIYLTIYQIYAHMKICIAAIKIAKSLPTKAYNIQCLSNENFIYIMGSRSETLCGQPECYRYDIENDKYYKLKSYPKTPTDHSIAKYIDTTNNENKLYIFSLENTNKNPNVCGFIVYDCVNDKWIQEYESHSSYLHLNSNKLCIQCISNKHLFVHSGDRFENIQYWKCFSSHPYLHKEHNFGIFNIDALSLNKHSGNNQEKRQWIRNLMLERKSYRNVFENAFDGYIHLSNCNKIIKFGVNTEKMYEKDVMYELDLRWKVLGWQKSAYKFLSGIDGTRKLQKFGYCQIKNSMLLIFGGYQRNYLHPSNKIFMIDIRVFCNAHKYHYLSIELDEKLPKPMYGCSVVYNAKNDTIHVLGGAMYDGISHSDNWHCADTHYIYDLYRLIPPFYHDIIPK